MRDAIVHSIMITRKELQEGCEFLGIENKEEIFNIINNCWENHFFMIEQAKLKKAEIEQQERIKNRFVIPFGKTKKFYAEMKKNIQKDIDALMVIMRERPDSIIAEDYHAKYVEMKGKLQFILDKPAKQSGEVNIGKAKLYPIDLLLDFKMGFAICPFHSEKSGSLKYYIKENTCYCFGACQKKYDAIDVYMKLYNVSLIQAVKKLSQ